MFHLIIICLKFAAPILTARLARPQDRKTIIARMVEW